MSTLMVKCFGRNSDPSASDDCLAEVVDKINSIWVSNINGGNGMER